MASAPANRERIEKRPSGRTSKGTAGDLRKGQSSLRRGFAHVGYIQHGKGPGCLPGSKCWEENLNHWKREIKGWIKVLERYTKRLKGKALKKLQDTINELQRHVG
jgi:hypothetical protein